jgi:hypothetical protein
MKNRILFIGFFLIIFLLFETILFYPQFIYVFIALLGASSIFCFLKIKKRFGFNYRVFLWLTGGPFYLLSSSFFVMFISEVLLRHLISFLSAFLFAFWLERFYLFLLSASSFVLRRGTLEDKKAAGDSSFIAGDAGEPETIEAHRREIDTFLFRVLSLSSFYFGISSIYGASIFLNVHPLLLAAFFILLIVFCTILFWEFPFKIQAGAFPLETKESHIHKKFLWSLIAILCLELAVAVYFLPLSIFSLGALVFIFWMFLTGITYDYSSGIFKFKKYKGRLILFLIFTILILMSAEWV